MTANRFSSTFQRQVQLLSVDAHPTYLASGHSHHKRKVGDIFIDNGAGDYKRIFANRLTTNNCAIRTQRGPALYQRVAILIFTINKSPRVIDVRKHHARPTENSVFQRDVFIDRHVMLNLATIAADHLVSYAHVLAKASALS